MLTTPGLWTVFGPLNSSAHPLQLVEVSPRSSTPCSAPTQPHSASTQLCLRLEQRSRGLKQREKAAAALAEEPGLQHGADGGETAPSPGSAGAGFGLVPSAPLAQQSCGCWDVRGSLSTAHPPVCMSVLASAPSSYSTLQVCFYTPLSWVEREKVHTASLCSSDVTP